MKVECDWCGETFHRAPADVSERNFCCRDHFERYKAEHGQELYGTKSWSPFRKRLWRMAHGLSPDPE